MSLRRQDYDVVIVGGGIAGNALATVLARTGQAVLVLERSSVYRDRVRGEGFSRGSGRGLASGPPRNVDACRRNGGGGDRRGCYAASQILTCISGALRSCGIGWMGLSIRPRAAW